MLSKLSRLLRWSLPEVLHAILWKLGFRVRASKTVQQSIFTRVYEQYEWGTGESRSGPGSTRARGADFRSDLVDLLSRFNVSSILDAPCGDFNWMRDLITAQRISYVGVDIVEDLIATNRQRFSSASCRFECGDLTRDPLPKADLIFCRDCLVHLSDADIRAAINNFKQSGSRYLLTTSFVDVQINVDVRTGGFRALNLQAAPFAFPDPLAFIDDVPVTLQPIYRRKRLCLWELESVP